VNELITAAIREEDVQVLNDFPQELMNDWEKDICLWIADYMRKYSKMPTLTRLQKEFVDFLPLKSVDPLLDIFDREVLEKKRLLATNMVATLSEALREPRFDPAGAIADVHRTLSVSQTGLIKYSTFDREEYFKPRTPLMFHFPLIDKVTGGLLNGDLGYIVGRLGTGKSTTAQWVTHQWWKDGKRMLFISGEMMPIDVLMRLDAMVGGFNPRELRMSTKTLGLQKKVQIVSHVAAASKGEIIFPKNRMMTPSAVIGAATQLEVDAVIIDGVYLMRTDRFVASKWERVAEISNHLKQGALSLGIPFLGITQLRRLGGKEKVEVEDIAYSDALGQDADVVLSITPTDVPNQIELELIKNRFGDATIGTQLTIDWDHMRILDGGAAPVL